MPSNQTSNGECSNKSDFLEKFRYRKVVDRPNTASVGPVLASSQGGTFSQDATDMSDYSCSSQLSETPLEANKNGAACIPETPERRSPSPTSPEDAHNRVTCIPETPENQINQPTNIDQNGHRARSNSLSDSEEPVVSRKSKAKRVLLSDSESDCEKGHSTKKIKSNVNNQRQNKSSVLEPPEPGSLAADLIAYDLFTDKELGLRLLMQAFPKRDLMKLQDTLVKCNWQAKKAIHVLQDGCDPSTCDHVTEPVPAPVSDPESKSLPETPVKSSFQTELLPTTSESEHSIVKQEESVEMDEEECNHSEESQMDHAVVLKTEENDKHDPGVDNTPSFNSTDDSQSPKVQSIIDKRNSDNESPADVESIINKRKIIRQRIHQLSSDDESDDSTGEVKIVSMANLQNIKSRKVPAQVARKNEHYVSSDENEDNNQEAKAPSPAPTKKKKKGKKSRKRDVAASDDEADFSRDDLYDSEDSDIDDQLTPAREAVLNFFRNATSAELLTVPGCSKKKVDLIINLRPIDGWIDLVKKLQSSRTLSTDMLGAARDVIVTREVMTKLMQKCEKIAGDMEKVVAQMKSKSSKGNYIKDQPSNLNQSMTLAPYQLLGLNWLWVMHCRRLNGILADEMGLGKTIQAISFLAHLKNKEGNSRHLIIVPSSTMDNWIRELHTWCPCMEVITYHGSQETRRELRLQIINDEIEEFDVMVTTYNMISSSPEDRTLFRRLEFHYVVFDEAHMLKNMNTQRYQNLMKIKADRRLLLTGTPLQNNLVELMSLLIFVMPDMFYGKVEQVKQMFASACKSEENRSDYEKDRIEHAKRIMKPFVLRRLKTEVLKQLPTKHEELLHCIFTSYQKDLYTGLVATFSKKMSEEPLHGTTRQSGIGMMMELRKVANHPLLIRKKYTEKILKEMSKKLLNEPTYVEANQQYIYEDMEVMSDFELHRLCKNFKSISSYKLTEEEILDSGKFQNLDNLLPDMKKEGNRFLLFSQFTMMLDIVEEYMAIRNYTYLRLDGSTPVTERQDMMDRFNGNPDIFGFLLSTKAGGLGINLTAANIVLLHDIDFNPYNDKQAEDRCHRLGQTKEVTVKKMIMKDSIEEAILKSALDKLKLERDITTDNNEDAEEDLQTVSNLLKTALGL